MTDGTECTCGAAVTCPYAVGIDQGNTKHCPYQQRDAQEETP